MGIRASMLRAGFDAEALLGMGMLEDLDGRGFIAPAAPFVQSRRFKVEFYSSLAAKYTCITCPMNTRRIASPPSLDHLLQHHGTFIDVAAWP